MGINIILYKILSIKKEEWCGREYDVCTTECIEWFDHLRYSGDREFMSKNDFEDLDSEGYYVRPSNFTETREWILKNIHEGNQERLLKALDYMEQEPMAAFSISY